jgi:3-oxoacyl-[acyl-carrier-protein] synthase-3
VSIAALTCAVPSFVQKINPETSHDPAYVKNFIKQTGVIQRHISITEQTSTDLGYGAALKALEKAGWDCQSIDGLVFMCQTPDYNPANGNALIAQYILGLRHDILAFDITLGCSSFPYGLAMCASLLQQEHINRLLMISGDTAWHMYPSREALLADESFLFGEACTAILLEKQRDRNINISLHSDGSGYKHMFHPFGGIRNHWRYAPKVILPNGVEWKWGAASYMDGLEIMSFSTTTVVDSIRDFLARQGKIVDDYDGLVLHQANQQIIKTMSKRLKIDIAKVPASLDRYANTSGASTSLTIADAYAGFQKGKLSLLTASFGIGLSWGIASLDIDPAVIEPIFTYDGLFEEGFAKPGA